MMNLSMLVEGRKALKVRKEKSADLDCVEIA